MKGKPQSRSFESCRHIILCYKNIYLIKCTRRVSGINSFCIILTEQRLLKYIRSFNNKINVNQKQILLMHQVEYISSQWSIIMGLTFLFYLYIFSYLSWSWSYGSWIYCYLCTNVTSSNDGHGEVYPLQHYVIKFVGGFLQVLRFPL
jgi:hypothetical protein